MIQLVVKGVPVDIFRDVFRDVARGGAELLIHWLNAETVFRCAWLITINLQCIAPKDAARLLDVFRLEEQQQMPVWGFVVVWLGDAEAEHANAGALPRRPHL